MGNLLVFEEPTAFRAYGDDARRGGDTLGFVPTMGALHAGHMALVAEAKRRAARVAVSIFVNPTQFAPGEDLDRYPRTFEADRAACEAAGVDAIFLPRPESMYLPGESTRVTVRALQSQLCGASRPTHFEGVATVVTKLFALSGPCVAVFGRKDFQQLRLIQRLVEDLFLPVTVVGHEIVRDPDGLALSSRNQYLSASDRRRALEIVASLRDAQRRASAGESAVDILAAVRDRLSGAGLRVDYAEVVSSDTLQPVAGRVQRAVLAVAAYAGNTRLIDNVDLAGSGAKDTWEGA